MRIHPFLCAAALATTLATTVTRFANAEDTIVTVKEDDAKMNAAIKKAQKTLPQFIQALRTKKNLTNVRIKYPFHQNMKVEHMWIRNVHVQGNKFVGVVGNHPNLVTNIKKGDTVRVSATSISDWMYVQNGKLVGGYTVRALRAQLSPQDRKVFDQSLSFKID